MYIKRRICVLAVIYSFLIVSLTSSFNLSDHLVLDENILTGTLSNGYTYYIKKNDEPKNIAEFRLGLKVGSLYEDDDQLGAAHFVEHLAFSGTEHFPADSLRTYLSSLGFGFMGGLNAATSHEFTIYFLSSRTDDKEQLDNSVLILSDWAGRVTFEHEKINKERGIILEEMRGGRGAGDRLMNQVYGTFYAGSRFANRMAIGTQESIENMEYQRLKDFYNDWYQPELMSIVAVGDFDPLEIERLIKKHFNSLPKKVNPRKPLEITVPTFEEPRLSFLTDREQTYSLLMININHPRSDLRTIGDLRQNTINSLANLMLNNRYAEISRKPNPPFVYAYNMYSSRANQSLGAFSIQAQVDENQIVEGFTALITEFERVQQHGFHNSELIRAKDSFKANYLKAYNERDKMPSTRWAMTIAFNLLRENIILNPEVSYQLNKVIIDTITMEDIMEAFEMFMTDQNKAITITTPENITIDLPSEETILTLFKDIRDTLLEPFPETTLDEPLLVKMPKKMSAGKPKHDKSIDLYTWKLKNGATVHLKPTTFRNNEILFNAFRFGGLSQAEDEIYKSADVATQIIAESGIGPFDNTQLDIYLEGKDVRFNRRLNDKLEGFSGSSSKEHFETFMQLLWQNFMAHRFDEDAAMSLKNRFEIQLRNLENSPEFNFQQAQNKLLYNDNLRMNDFTVEDLELTNHEDAFNFYQSRFSSANGFSFVFVGNITPKELQKYIEQYIAPLPATKVSTERLDRGIQLNIDPKRVEIFHGQDDKTLVNLIYPSLNFEFTTKNSTIVAAISGILFESLIENVREKMSGVYMIFASPDMQTNPDGTMTWEIFFGCAPGRIDEIIVEINNQLTILINGEFEEKYLHSWRETYRKGLEAQVRTNNYWLSTIASCLQNNFALKNIPNMQEIADSITREDIMETANKQFDLNTVHTIILFPENMKENP